MTLASEQQSRTSPSTANCMSESPIRNVTEDLGEKASDGRVELTFPLLKPPMRALLLKTERGERSMRAASGETFDAVISLPIGSQISCDLLPRE
jgi:hypothetical protein